MVYLVSLVSKLSPIVSLVFMGGRVERVVERRGRRGGERVAGWRGW